MVTIVWIMNQTWTMLFYVYSTFIHSARLDVCSCQSSLPGRGRSCITGLAGILGLRPNSEPCGNNRSFLETREPARVPVKKIGSRDSLFDLVHSTYFFTFGPHRLRRPGGQNVPAIVLDRRFLGTIIAIFRMWLCPFNQPCIRHPMTELK